VRADGPLNIPRGIKLYTARLKSPPTSVRGGEKYNSTPAFLFAFPPFASFLSLWRLRFARSFHLDSSAIPFVILGGRLAVERRNRLYRFSRCCCRSVVEIFFSRRLSLTIETTLKILRFPMSVFTISSLLVLGKFERIAPFLRAQYFLILLSWAISLLENSFLHNSKKIPFFSRCLALFLYFYHASSRPRNFIEAREWTASFVCGNLRARLNPGRGFIVGFNVRFRKMRASE